MPAKSQLAATTIVTNFTEESREGFDYFVLTISEEVSGSILLYQTVRVNIGEISQRAISTSGIEVLEDDDGDGVSNFNERLRGTDLADAESKPGESSLDVIVIYTQGVPALYDGDPSARIDQLVQVSNQVFQNSGLDITMNLTHTVEKTVAESSGLNTLLDMLEILSFCYFPSRQEMPCAGWQISLVLIWAAISLHLIAQSLPIRCSILIATIQRWSTKLVTSWGWGTPEGKMVMAVVLLIGLLATVWIIFLSQ